MYTDETKFLTANIHQHMAVKWHTHFKTVISSYTDYVGIDISKQSLGPFPH